MNFTHKKIIGLILFGLIVVIATIFATIQFNSIIVGSALGLLCILPGFLIMNAVLTDPLLDTLEGRGFLGLDIGSPGVIQPYLVQVALPNITINAPRGPLSGIFDRKISNYLMNPKKGTVTTIADNMDWKNLEAKPGDMVFVLKQEDITKAQFATKGRPTFLFNSKLNSIITKEMIAESESKIMTEHLTLNLLASMREFKLAVSHLNKSFADLFKPNSFANLLRNPIVGIILAVVIILILWLFLGPQLPKLFGGVAESVQGVVPSGGAPVAPPNIPKP